jgi:hypothetical protein
MIRVEYLDELQQRNNNNNKQPILVFFFSSDNNTLSATISPDNDTSTRQSLLHEDRDKNNTSMLPKWLHLAQGRSRTIF